MSVNFIIQAIRVLYVNQYTKEDLEMIYNFTINLDNKVLNGYFIANTALSYENDLELYLEVVDALIKIYERNEEYEKCAELMAQKNKSLKIIKNKTKNYA